MSGLFVVRDLRGPVLPLRRANDAPRRWEHRSSVSPAESRRMSYRFSFPWLKPRHWLWLTLIPVLSVCTGDRLPTATSIATRRQPHAGNAPGTVTDLTASSVSSTSVTLSFTQVDDGTGQPAHYDVRYAAGPITWS